MAWPQASASPRPSAPTSAHETDTALVHHLRNVSILNLDSQNCVRASPSGLTESSTSSGDAISHETGASGSASSYIHVQANAPTAANGAAHSRPSTSASATHHHSSLVSRSPPPNTDGEDGTSGNAWAVGSHWGRALDASHADDARTEARSLETALAGSGLSANERLSAYLTHAYQLYALGDFDGALAAYDQFDWSSPPTTGMVQGDAAVVERIRARTCQGICAEHSYRADPSRALQAYLDAVSLMERLSVSPMNTPSYLRPANESKTSSPNLESQRELYRHISTALTRAAVIAARGSDTHLTLRILRTYHALSASWTGSFRANQRQRMLSLYLSALYASYPAAGAIAPEPHLLVGGTPARSARTIWRLEVIEALRNGQGMLNQTTIFPKAGDVNEAVTEFATQAAAFPDLAPSLSHDATALLWWATSLTFQSQPILRHLVRLLSSSGDPVEARRSFELYVKIVLKSRQTQDPESPLTLERHPTETEEDEVFVEAETGDGSGPSEREVVELESDMDSDEEFVSALLVGTRLILARFGEAEEAWRYATLAGEVVKRGRVSPSMAAKVEQSRGIVRLAMSTSGEYACAPQLTIVAGPQKRPEYQTQAVNHLRAATTLDHSSSEAFYHLSYAYATARHIDHAVGAIHTALQLDPQSVRAWHLLALLLTAQGDWNAAYKAGETGIALWEADDDAITSDEADTATECAPILTAPTLLLPNGEVAPTPAAPAERPSKFARLETVIQLRMTLNVITEKLHGPDAALEKHQQLFQFFSKRTEARGGSRASTAVSEPGSGHSNPPQDLGGSYVLTSPIDATSTSPAVVATHVDYMRSQNASPPTVATPASGQSSGPSDGEGSQPSRRVTIVGHKKSLFPKHLHVPSVARSNSRSGNRAASAPAGMRSPPLRSVSSPVPYGGRSRTASAASTLALSIAPTAVHSHYRGARGGAMPPPPAPIKRGVQRTLAEERILSDLWLMSAASFRRVGRYGQALVAIEEAENHDPENPAVWVQLGLLKLVEDGYGTNLQAVQDGTDDAAKAFTKALLLSTDYPSAVVSLARLYLRGNSSDIDLAHSILWQLTEDRGWDVPEAWLSLATACQKQGRPIRQKECLLEALRLENSRTCRPLGDAFSHF